MRNELPQIKWDDKKVAIWAREKGRFTSEEFKDHFYLVFCPIHGAVARKIFRDRAVQKLDCYCGSHGVKKKREFSQNYEILKVIGKKKGRNVYEYAPTPLAISTHNFPLPIREKVVKGPILEDDDFDFEGIIPEDPTAKWLREIADQIEKAKEKKDIRALQDIELVDVAIGGGIVKREPSGWHAINFQIRFRM